MVGSVRRSWLLVAVGALLVACATGGEADGSASGSPAPEGLFAATLAQVDWPEDEAAVDAVFSALPERIGDAELAGTQRRDPDDEDSSYLWFYYSESGHGFIEVWEAVSPHWLGRMHAMIFSAAWSGYPESCVDADVSAPFGELLAEEWADVADGDFSRLPADPGELLWVACTATQNPDGDDYAEDDLNYVAHWSDGEAVYSVDSWGEDMRRELVAALVDAVQQSG